MKKFLAIILVLTMALSFAACGDTEPDNPDDVQTPDVGDVNTDEDNGDEVTAQLSALEVLNTVWDNIPEENRFMAFGGDYNEENQVENAPGVHNIATDDDAAALDSGFGLPADMIGKISEAAALRHMLNVNTFTCAALKVTDTADTESVCTGIRDGLMNRAYMCGWPEWLYVCTVPSSDGDIVVSFFGSKDLLDTFKSTLESSFSGVKTVVDQSLEEAGGDNTVRFEVPELG